MLLTFSTCLSRCRRLIWLASAVSLSACAPEPHTPPSSLGTVGFSASAPKVSAATASVPASNAPEALPASARPPEIQNRVQAPQQNAAAVLRYDLEGICEVKPKTLVPIKSQASGEVTAVRVDVGDVVKKGQLLIEISPRTLAEQMERNQLSRERVQKRSQLLSLQIATQKREAKVLEELYSEAGNSKNTLAIRERETELESTKIELRELQIRQREIERELHYTQIQSPGAGIVVKRTVEPGQVVNAAGGSFGGGDGLLELADQSELALDCAVHAEDADLIAQKVPLEVLLSRAKRTTAGVVLTRIAPMIDSKGQVPQLRFTAKFTAAAPAEVLLGARYPLQRPKAAP